MQVSTLIDSGITPNVPRSMSLMPDSVGEFIATTHLLVDCCPTPWWLRWGRLSIAATAGGGRLSRPYGKHYCDQQSHSLDDSCSML
jgi:hypothetical protein